MKTPLDQTIADLEYIATHPGNILVLLEKRRAEREDMLFAEAMEAH